MSDTAATAPRVPDSEIPQTTIKVAMETSWWARLHPIGWLAGSVIVIAVVVRLLATTEYWIGNLAWWNWLVLAGALAMGFWHDGLDRVRRSLESIATVSRTIAWILAWVVFLLQLFNVITRYSNDLVEADILFGETASLAWQSFGLMFLLAVNFGVRDGVNPRIDFWWANFSDKRKAWLDFVIHAGLLLPFIVMAVRILKSYAATSLGRRHNGEWPSGWRVWESWEQAVDAGGLPVGPIKVMILVAFVLFGLQIIAELIKTGFVIIGDNKRGNIVELDSPLRVE
ncbi:TRAP transporter small permease subunit [Candidatus Poriferisodalis sp.]|uniref:TRAP transporter small permease subunit n=1 Tax=Candidatus Poriferisodalis sp. TaxID=3101277 RepID=UPI003B02957D